MDGLYYRGRLNYFYMNIEKYKKDISKIGCCQEGHDVLSKKIDSLLDLFNLYDRYADYLFVNNYPSNSRVANVFSPIPDNNIYLDTNFELNNVANIKIIGKSKGILRLDKCISRIHIKDDSILTVKAFCCKVIRVFACGNSKVFLNVANNTTIHLYKEQNASVIIEKQCHSSKIKHFNNGNIF